MDTGIHQNSGKYFGSRQCKVHICSFETLGLYALYQYLKKGEYPKVCVNLQTDVR